MLLDYLREAVFWGQECAVKIKFNSFKFTALLAMVRSEEVAPELGLSKSD